LKEKDAQFKTDRKLVIYVEKNDGVYRPIETGSYMIETHFDDFLEKRHKLKNSYSDKLKKGEISPIEYYRVLINISISDLASRIGLSSRKVKKHLQPENFKSIKLNILKRYAEVFRVPVANMFQILDQDDSNQKFEQIKSENPYIITTTIREEINADN
jgi:transcriptional regulator with XRE-family HTH domain